MKKMSSKNIKLGSSKSTLNSNISTWLKRETPGVQNALETASRHFDRNDVMDVHTLEAVYAKESSFGQSRGRRNGAGPAGDFQIKKSVATEMGLQVSKVNDERFDVNAASSTAAKILKTSDGRFRKVTKLDNKSQTFAVKNAEERKKFALAAYNAGEARIAGAQKLALEVGEDPAKWDIVKKYLEKAGATLLNHN